MRQTSTCFLVFAMAFFAACSPKPAVDTTASTTSALDLITEARLKEHVTILSDDAYEGREAGTDGYDRAATYVAEQLADVGVSPGAGDGWMQDVPLRSYKIDTSSATIIVHRDGEDVALTYRDDFAMGGDALRETNSVRAGVVYVGYGVHAPEFGYSDFDGVDVGGKIIAFFGGAPETIEGEERAYYASTRNKIREAVSRGAVGLLYLRSRKTEKNRSWEEAKKTFGMRPAMTWINDLGEAANYFPEILGTAFLSIEAAEDLFGIAPLSFSEALDAAEAAETASADLSVEITLSRRTEHSLAESANVVGLVRGTDAALADEYVVYSAHLDHVGVRGAEDEDDRIHNGAYDNAMGIALMLETARAIAAAPPRRSVLFVAVTAEEKGLLGSDFFASNPTVSTDAIVANINLDMPLFLFPVADLVAFGSERSSLHAMVEASAKDEGFAFSPDPLPEENLFVRSDQYSFVLQGIPSVYLMPGFTSLDDSIDGEAVFRDHLDNHYHEPSDDMNLVFEWSSALRFARANARIGLRVANAPDRPEWNEGDFFGLRYGKRTVKK